MDLSLSEKGKTEDAAGLEKANQYLSFGFVKCEFSIRQIKKKMKIVSDNDVCHEKNSHGVTREVLLR